MLLGADILTLCFIGWVILIWNRCFSSCWLESLPKEKAGSFQGYFCVSCLLCRGFLKQKSQTSTYNPNQGSYLGGTQSVYQIPWKLWELWARSSFENQTSPFFFFVSRAPSRNTNAQIWVISSFLVCLLSFLVELRGEAMMVMLMMWYFSFKEARRERGSAGDDGDPSASSQRDWVLNHFFKKPWAVFGTDVLKSLNFEGLCAFWEENCSSGGAPQQPRWKIIAVGLGKAQGTCPVPLLEMLICVWLCSFLSFFCLFEWNGHLESWQVGKQAGRAEKWGLLWLS